VIPNFSESCSDFFLPLFSPRLHPLRGMDSGPWVGRPEQAPEFSEEACTVVHPDTECAHGARPDLFHLIFHPKMIVTFWIFILIYFHRFVVPTPRIAGCGPTRASALFPSLCAHLDALLGDPAFLRGFLQPCHMPRPRQSDSPVFLQPFPLG